MQTSPKRDPQNHEDVEILQRTTIAIPPRRERFDGWGPRLG